MVPLFLSLLLFSSILAKDCSSEPLVPALYVFGDSLSDAGNNNNVASFAKANYRPYGVNFPEGVTGRFTNGQTFGDLIAGYLGLPYPAAYRKRPRSQTGYTYASAGCGILPLTGSNLDCMSMELQVNKFQQTIEQELGPILDNPTELNEYLSNSIFLVWAGSNDYLLNYFNGKRPQYSSEEFADLLVATLSDQLKALYELGARKFVVVKVGPLGCLPVYRKNGGHDETWCDETKNINATMFNQRLQPMVLSLTNVSHSCCRTGELLGNIPCYVCNRWPCIGTCETPNQYMFFDGAHPSEASFSIMASHCFNGSDICVPYNIQQLVQLQPKNDAYLHSAT